MNPMFILILTLIGNGQAISHIEIVGEEHCNDAGKAWLASVKESENQGIYSNTKASFICVPKR